MKEYRAYKLPSGEIALVVDTIEIEERTKLRIYLRTEARKNSRRKVGELVKGFLEELEKMDYEKGMVHDEWISLLYRGKDSLTLDVEGSSL